jgi:microsomal dipeptidase-like Zn-dependent dipeptidase
MYYEKKTVNCIIFFERFHLIPNKTNFMKRRTFIKNTIIGSVGIKMLPTNSYGTNLLFGKTRSIEDWVLSDFHIHSSLKSFNAETVESPWVKMENDCMGHLVKWMVKVTKEMPKYSQANFEALVKANVRLACVSIVPIEKKMIMPSLVNDKKNHDTTSCITGISKKYDYEQLKTEEINYFDDLVSHIEYLLSYNDKPHDVDGKSFTCKFPSSGLQLANMLQESDVLAVVLTIEGGHSLTHSIENKDVSNTLEFKELALNNVKKLKGILPLRDNDTAKTLDIPIFSLGLNHFFWNGLSGQARTLSKAQNLLMSQKSHIDEGIKPLGMAVVELLLKNTEGRRILIDIKHMSLATRKWYYDFVAKMRKQGDNIPILCTHSGIAGLSWNDAKYTHKDKKNKLHTSFLNNWTINLSNEDILEIYLSKGMIGLQLDKKKLCGSEALKLISSTYVGTKQRKQVYIKIIAANILTIIKAINNKKAWNILCIGSDYDGLITPFEIYPTSAEFGLLAMDLVNFFSNPVSISTLFSVEDIKKLMFGFTSMEIVERIMSSNLRNFMVEHL